jgi:hypothetical protein
MKSSGTRTITFLSGIFLGMLAALGLVFLLLNDFNPIRFFENGDGVNSNDTVVVNQSGKIKQSRNSSKIQKPVSNLEISLAEDSSIQLAAQSDSQQLEGQVLSNDDIIVKRDELISSYPLTLIVQDKQVARTKSDSLLRNFQGDSNKPIDYRIEFWKSPVNFKGFKFVRNAIIVFGLDPQDPVKLYSLDDKLFLKQGTQVYKLHITEKFEAFSKVTEENTLKQLR